MLVVSAVGIRDFAIVEPVDLVHRRDQVDAEVHQGDHLILAHENVESPRSLGRGDFLHEIEQRVAHGLELARHTSMSETSLSDGPSSVNSCSSSD
jgi:hypothetical protein